MLRLFASYAAAPARPATTCSSGSAWSTSPAPPYRRLSGGQQQRLSLALAVVGRPELVFLDEPTAGLDPQARHATWELVEALRADGVTVVLTTHLLDEAERAGRRRRHRRPRPRRRRRVGRRSSRASDATGQLRFRATPGPRPRPAAAWRCPPAARPRSRRPGAYVVEGPHGAAIDPQVLATVTAWCAGTARWPATCGSTAAPSRTSSSTSPDGSCARDGLGARARSRPGPAPRRCARMLAAQTAAELKLVLRNGEQVLLSLVIPLGAGRAARDRPVHRARRHARRDRADFFVPGVLALAVMSTAFTGQAIAVGFERQYGVLKRLGATPLPRVGAAGRQDARRARRRAAAGRAAVRASAWRSAGTRRARRSRCSRSSSSAPRPSAGSGCCSAGRCAG